MSKFRRALVNNKGFTLIELLVVIAVLGILAAIAIPRLTGVTDKARTSEAVSALGSIKTALEMYSVENNGDYPEAQDNGTVDDFDAVVSGYLDGYDESAQTWNGWDVDYTGPGNSWSVELSTGTLTATLDYTSGTGYSQVQTSN